MSLKTVAVCAFGVFFFYFYYGILQEKLFRQEYGTEQQKERFEFVITALFLQCFSSCLTAFAALKIQKQPTNDVIRGGQFPMLSVFYLGAMLCSNYALKYVSYPTQVIGKSCKPIPIMLLGVLFAGKRYAVQKYFFVAMIVAGVAVFTYKDVKPKPGDSSTGFSLGMGEALLLFSLIQDGCIAAIQDRLKAIKRPSSYQMMFAMNLWSTVIGFVLVLLFQELFPLIVFISKHPEVFYNLCMFCACSVLGQVFIFKSITELSPLTCSIITTTRKCFTVLASVMLFGNSISTRQWGGVVLVFSGLFMDSYFGAKR